MPWKEKGLEAMREEFVLRALANEKSKSALCREYGISRPTGDKWIARYLAGEDLSNQSRAPKTVPHKTEPEMEALIISYRKQYPFLGAAKLHRMLLDEGHVNIPCVKTINNIFNRNGLITPEASLASSPNVRFEKDKPNEMWQSDFKGDFEMQNGSRCHPLNVVDDCARFCLCCGALGSETYDEVRLRMEETLKEYGLPRTFLCDNGNPWGVSQAAGFTKFEVWFMELGILTLHGRSWHPQTQGKEERFNGSLTRECLKYNTFENQKDAERKFSEYRNFYNNKRPHHALGLKTPASVYRKSERTYPKQIEEWEYDVGYERLVVKKNGHIRLGNKHYFLSEAFAGKSIAIRESSKGGGLINLYFRQFKIGQIDVDKRVFTFKRAYLIQGDPRLAQP